MVLVLVALAGLARAADFIYVDTGTQLGVLEGKILSETEDEVRFQPVEGEALTLARQEVVALERGLAGEEPFVVTETDLGLLQEALDRFVRLGDEALEAADDPEGPAERKHPHYREARIAYERALVCLERIQELDPDRQRTLAAQERMIITNLSHARKFCGFTREEVEGTVPSSPLPSDPDTPSPLDGDAPPDTSPPAPLDGDAPPTEPAPGSPTEPAPAPRNPG